MKILKSILLGLCVSTLCLPNCFPVSPLQKFKGSELIASDANDGDSFLAKVNGEELHLRLYYVDCPEMKDRMADLEAVAMLTRSGIWSETDPERLIALRAEMRKEDLLLRKLKQELDRNEIPDIPLDINKATASQLQFIKGIGPKRAGSIINHRPYKQLDELYKLPRMPANVVDRMIPLLKIDTKDNQPN